MRSLRLEINNYVASYDSMIELLLRRSEETPSEHFFAFSNSAHQ